ncbi:MULTISPECIES: TetR/AcrR family transcriptional regulator [unclassified Pedobacter]|uniref:TetR/AcrR family transcriptional regulator n=1 Tax=unclassified Pedobacter TaxID=2628915 RepID=UPI001E56E328|nr:MULTISPECIES: TetR/AcrR family transcriptional regulator [unclassified Pedobacter]
MIVADKKREQIIEGAIKRFSHFGINKTTMNDIADDLAVSKPSLYYYFPDKKHLILGVIEKIFNEFFEAMQKKRSAEQSLEANLMNTIDVRNTFFQKYYMLKIAEGVPDLLNDEAIKSKLNALKEIELNFFAELFTHAKAKGEIEHEDSNHIAELYLESLMGLTTMCVIQTGKDIVPDKKILNKMTQKQKDLSIIFTRGLRCE